MIRPGWAEVRDGLTQAAVFAVAAPAPGREAVRRPGAGQAQPVKPSMRASICSITSSAPPPMDNRRLSRK